MSFLHKIFMTHNMDGCLERTMHVSLVAKATRFVSTISFQQG